MIENIISGGQTGADRAALDAAIELDIPHGGWVPKGRIAEDGIIPEKYEMQEMPTSSYSERTEQNIIDSDGTLIISHGQLTGGSAFTQELSNKHNRPCLHIDLDVTPAFKAAKMIDLWVETHDIKTLNVAGPRASKDPHIYKQTKDILECVYHIGLIKNAMPESKMAQELIAATLDTTAVPKTVDQAVEILISNMPLRDKVIIANMKIEDLAALHLSLGNYIRNRFELWSGNKALLDSCRSYSEISEIHADDASSIIITALWNALRETYKLRIVN